MLKNINPKENKLESDEYVSDSSDMTDDDLPLAIVLKNKLMRKKESTNRVFMGAVKISAAELKKRFRNKTIINYHNDNKTKILTDQQLHVYHEQNKNELRKKALLIPKKKELKPKKMSNVDIIRAKLENKKKEELLLKKKKLQKKQKQKSSSFTISSSVEAKNDSNGKKSSSDTSYIAPVTADINARVLLLIFSFKYYN